MYILHFLLLMPVLVSPLVKITINKFNETLHKAAQKVESLMYYLVGTCTLLFLCSLPCSTSCSDVYIID